MEETAPVSGMTERARCASCGRFVGPYETCPYCGAHIRGRLPIRTVKIAAILLTLVGLIGLWWVARRTEIPLLTIEEAQGTMNLAYVRVRGRVVRSLTYDPESDYLGFWVDDGTGEVHISAYRDVTQALMVEERIPAVGDEVEVAGTLRIREDYVSLTLNVAEHLARRRPEPVRVKLGSLGPLDEGLRVWSVGEVRRVRSPYEGLTLITVRDDSGEVPIVVDETFAALFGELPEIVEGQGLAVTGTVTLYRDEPQITPASLEDVRLVAAPPEEIVAIESRELGSLTAADEGGWYRVQGRVVAMTGLKGGMKATLDDGTGQIFLLLWDSVYDALPEPQALDVGAEVEVEGEIQLYEGDLELVPEQPEDIRIQVAAPESPWVEVSTLSGLDAGRVVRLRGVLGEPQAFSAGIKAPLDDGTGIITVLLWSNVAEVLEPPPAGGLLVEVVGEISLYRDELEIIPRSRHDWRSEP